MLAGGAHMSWWFDSVIQLFRVAAEMTYFSMYQFFFKMCFTLSLFSYHGKSAVGTWLANVTLCPQNKLMVKCAGMLTLSPMMVAPVCRVGDPLQITCTASVDFIRWSILVVNEHGMNEEITAIRNSLDPLPPIQRIINSTFHFHKNLCRR